jgi:hypothetical protein
MRSCDNHSNVQFLCCSKKCIELWNHLCICTINYLDVKDHPFVACLCDHFDVFNKFRNTGLVPCCGFSSSTNAKISLLASRSSVLLIEGDRFCNIHFPTECNSNVGICRSRKQVLFSISGHKVSLDLRWHKLTLLSVSHHDNAHECNKRIQQFHFLYIFNYISD